ncbi:MAG TPA: hypothetical protein VGO93_18725 [Candidatus Xenobia bacterium]|jgi:hypothetical protein
MKGPVLVLLVLLSGVASPQDTKWRYLVSPVPRDLQGTWVAHGRDLTPGGQSIECRRVLTLTAGMYTLTITTNKARMDDSGLVGMWAVDPKTHEYILAWRPNNGDRPKVDPDGQIRLTDKNAAAIGTIFHGVRQRNRKLTEKNASNWNVSVWMKLSKDGQTLRSCSSQGLYGFRRPQ